jgi:hypothetical protein
VGTRIFLGLNVLVWLPYGLYCFVEPGYLAQAAGVTAATATGSTELRAMYGGLQIGIGTFALAAVLNAALVRPALLALAFLAGGLGIARISGAVLDDGWSFYTGMGMGFEFTILAVSIVLLRANGGGEPALSG